MKRRGQAGCLLVFDLLRSQQFDANYGYALASMLVRFLFGNDLGNLWCPRFNYHHLAIAVRHLVFVHSRFSSGGVDGSQHLEIGIRSAATPINRRSLVTVFNYSMNIVPIDRPTTKWPLAGHRPTRGRCRGMTLSH